MLKWVTAIILTSGYFGLFFMMLLENLIPPIPSEFIMPLGGYMVAEGHFNLLSIILVGTFGSVLGTLPMYFWGKRITEQRLHELTHKHGRWLTVSHKDIHRSIHWFNTYGSKAILFGRLIPGVRAIISLPAGLCGIRLVPFLLYMTLSTFVWNSFLAYAGFYLGKRFTILRNYMSVILGTVVLAVLVIYIVRVWRYKSRVENER